MIRTYNYNYGDFKQLSILIDRPWIRLVNMYNVRTLIPNKEEWVHWIGLYNKSTGIMNPEFYRVTRFYENIIKQAGRERKYLNLTTKPTIPQYKYLSLSTILESIDFGRIDILDKNTMCELRNRMNDTKISPLQEEQLKTAGPNIEARVFDYLISRFNEDVTCFHPRKRYWFGGKDNQLDMFSYYTTYAIFGALI